MDEAILLWLVKVELVWTPPCSSVVEPDRSWGLRSLQGSIWGILKWLMKQKRRKKTSFASHTCTILWKFDNCILVGLKTIVYIKPSEKIGAQVSHRYLTLDCFFAMHKDKMICALCCIFNNSWSLNKCTQLLSTNGPGDCFSTDFTASVNNVMMLTQCGQSMAYSVHTSGHKMKDPPITYHKRFVIICPVRNLIWVSEKKSEKSCM